MKILSFLFFAALLVAPLLVRAREEGDKQDDELSEFEALDQEVEQVVGDLGDIQQSPDNFAKLVKLGKDSDRLDQAAKALGSENLDGDDGEPRIIAKEEKALEEEINNIDPQDVNVSLSDAKQLDKDLHEKIAELKSESTDKPSDATESTSSTTPAAATTAATTAAATTAAATTAAATTAAATTAAATTTVAATTRATTTNPTTKEKATTVVITTRRATTPRATTRKATKSTAATTAAAATTRAQTTTSATEVVTTTAEPTTTAAAPTTRENGDADDDDDGGFENTEGTKNNKDTGKDDGGDGLLTAGSLDPKTDGEDDGGSGASLLLIFFVLMLIGAGIFFRRPIQRYFSKDTRYKRLPVRA